MKKDAPKFIKTFIFLYLPVMLVFLQPMVTQSAIRVILAFIFQLFPLLGIYLLGTKAVTGWLHNFGFKPQERSRICRFMVLFIITSIVFLIFYFRAEHDIKVYGSAANWMSVIAGRSLIRDSIWQYLLYLRNSLGQANNALSAFPLVFCSHLFGLSYTGYILSVYLVYYLPAGLLMTVFALRLSEPLRGKRQPGSVSFIFTFCFCTLSPALLSPVLRGYLDISALMLFLLLLNITLTWNGVQADRKKIIRLAVISAGILLLKEWYLFYLLAFYLVFGVYWAVKVEAFGSVIKNLLLILIITGVIIGVVNPEYFKVLAANFSIESTVYHNLNLLQNFSNIAVDSGVFVTVAAGVGLVLLDRREQGRPFGLLLFLCVAAATACLALFKDINFQERYMGSMILIVFTCVLTDFGVQYAYRTVKPLLAGSLILICAANFLFTTIPFFERYARMTRPFTAVINNNPAANHHTAVIRQMVADLTEQTAGTSDLVYVVGANHFLSTELLKRSNLPQQPDASPYAITGNIVDTRDGFPSQLFLAGYVIVNDPFVDSFDTRQQVSYQVYDMLVNDPAISDYYELNAVYHEGAENILVFRRIKPMDTVMVNHLMERLKRYYPDQPYIYQPDYFLALLGVRSPGGYEYNHYWNKNVIMQKEMYQPISLQWQTDAKYAELEFTISCWPDGLIMKLADETGVLYQTPVTSGDEVPYHFDIAGSKTVTLTIEAASFADEKTATLILGHQNDGLR